jgi:hypothetical protein
VLILTPHVCSEYLWRMLPPFSVQGMPKSNASS